MYPNPTEELVCDLGLRQVTGNAGPRPIKQHDLTLGLEGLRFVFGV